MDTDRPYTLSAGIDWGGEEHHVCVFDRTGRCLGDRAFRHSGEGLAELTGWLLGQGESDPTKVQVGIEVPRGAVVETLLERGFQVRVINPKQLERFRERYTVAGAKDDRRDAWAIGWTVQTDPHAFRALRIDDPQVIQLREWSRLDGELGEELRRAANRLRELLQRFYPQWLQLCPAADEAWMWAVLRVVPTPRQAQRVSKAVIQRALTRSRIRRVTADEVLTTLRTPALYVAPGTTEALSQRLVMLLPHLQLLHAQRTATEKRLKTLLKDIAATPGQAREHHDVTILLSLPGVGVRIAAAMLAEGTGPLGQRDYYALRTMSGLAPVTRASGKSRQVTMRYACHLRLRTACYHMARTALQRDAHVKAHYAALRRKGHSHPRALRGVADRHLKILVAMLASGTLYDASRRRPLADAA